MASAYNIEQRKARLFAAIKMRDAKVERVNHKTGNIEVLPYGREYIKKVTGIKAFEAVALGIFNKPANKLDVMVQQANRDLAFKNAKRQARGKAPLKQKPLKHAI